MDVTFVALVLAGSVAGGAVSGLAGFGTGMTALVLWLIVLDPVTAATLVIVCSVAAQLFTLPRIWRSILFANVAPFIIPGLIGVPLGTVLLTHVDPILFKIGVGCFITLYSTQALLLGKSSGRAWDNLFSNGIVGFFSGVLGGFAGLSGPLPTVWADICGWTKEKRRTIFQAFNLSILLAALVVHGIGGLITHDLLLASAVALPGTFFGAWLGFAAYKRLSDQRFREIILVLLALSGLSLMISSI